MSKKYLRFANCELDWFYEKAQWHETTGYSNPLKNSSKKGYELDDERACK